MNLLEIAQESVWRHFEQTSNQPYRLMYHLMPPTNWMNDPNGFCYFNGEYHIFYQHNPYEPKHGPMYWGHLSSPDLIFWHHCPIALAPDTEYDASCFSGSAVVIDNQLKLLYTSHDSSRVQKEMQSLATSTDGIRFEKYPGNPIITQIPEGASFDFRDPKVWRHENLWYMVLGSSRDQAGQAYLYRSEDLINWKVVGSLLENDGSLGIVWECPDIYPMGEYDVFACSPINSPKSRNALVIGKLDYDTGKLTPCRFQEADYGEDFYAMQSMLTPDGRRLMVAWMEKWRDEYVTAREGWVGAMALLREISMVEDCVRIRPIREMEQLREQEVICRQFIVDENGQNYLPEIQGNAIEIKAELKFSDPACLQGGIRLRVSDDQQQETRVYFDLQRMAVICDRSKSGLGSQVETFSPIDLKPDQTISLQIFIDHSSIEVFINDGESVISNRIYPNPGSINYDLFATGGSMEILDIKAWTLKSIWSREVR